MHENVISGLVKETAIEIHRRLGPGLLESVYETVLAHELRKRGLAVACQVPAPVEWDGIHLEIGFRIDLLVGDKVVVELKSVENVHPVHKKTVLTYLRLTDNALAYSSTSVLRCSRMECIASSTASKSEPNPPVSALPAPLREISA